MPPRGWNRCRPVALEVSLHQNPVSLRSVALADDHEDRWTESRAADPRYSSKRHAALRPGEVVERLTARYEGGGVVVPENLGGATHRYVV